MRRHGWDSGSSPGEGLQAPALTRLLPSTDALKGPTCPRYAPRGQCPQQQATVSTTELPWHLRAWHVECSCVRLRACPCAVPPVAGRTSSACVDVSMCTFWVHDLGSVMGPLVNWNLEAKNFLAPMKGQLCVPYVVASGQGPALSLPYLGAGGKA